MKSMRFSMKYQCKILSTVLIFLLLGVVGCDRNENTIEVKEASVKSSFTATARPNIILVMT